MRWFAILVVYAPGTSLRATPDYFIVAETDQRISKVKIVAQTTTLEAAQAAQRLLK